MATVRAKFKVSKMEYTEGTKPVLDEEGVPLKDAKGYYVNEPTEMVTIIMYPVYGNGDPHHDNTRFWQASPSGEFKLGCVNKAASDCFKIGQEWYLDMTLASEPK